MDYEHEINQIKKQLANLQDAFVQAQRNQVPLTAKTDDTAVKVDAITPYTDSKMAYFGEKEKTFYGVPQGNTSVFFSNYNGDYSVNRIADRLTVAFGTALTASTDITISIQ